MAFNLLLAHTFSRPKTKSTTVKMKAQQILFKKNITHFSKKFSWNAISSKKICENIHCRANKLLPHFLYHRCSHCSFIVHSRCYVHVRNLTNRTNTQRAMFQKNLIFLLSSPFSQINFLDYTYGTMKKNFFINALHGNFSVKLENKI